MTDQQVVERASTRTVLVLGEVEAPIGLFKVTKDPASRRKWAKPPDPEAEQETVDALAGSLAKSTGSKGKSSGSGGSGGGGGEGVSNSKADADATAPPEKPRKGILKEDGEYVDLTEHIEAVAERTTLDRLEVVSFIRREQVPRERIVNAFYVGAGGGKKAPFAPSQVLGLLYRGLKLRERAAVVRWGKRTKSSVGVMVAHGSGALVVFEMAYAENMLAPSPACLTHNHVAITDAQVERVADLIDSMAEGRASLDDIHDRRAELEDELIVRAEHGELDEFEAVSYGTDEAVGDLSSLIEESLTAKA